MTNEKTHRKQTKIIEILLKFIVGVLFWGTYFIPIYSFEQVFRLGVQSQDFWGIYRDGILIFSFLAIILTILNLKLSPKFFHKLFYKISIVVVYLVFYYYACTSIAWDYRIVFGNTWLWHEVFFELVAVHWYFYVFGLLGVFFHYQYQKLIQIKTNKI